MEALVYGVAEVIENWDLISELIENIVSEVLNTFSHDSPESVFEGLWRKVHAQLRVSMTKMMTNLNKILCNPKLLDKLTLILLIPQFIQIKSRISLRTLLLIPRFGT